MTEASRTRNHSGGQRGLQILPYQGYGTTTRLFLKGRVLHDGGIGTAAIDTPVWENLLNTYKRFWAEAASGAQVRVSFEGQQQQLATNYRGYFDVEMQFDRELNSDRLWHNVDLELLEPPLNYSLPIRSTGQVLLPASCAKFGIISDIDDTIVYTYNNDWLRMLQTVYLGNAHTRIPLPGIAAFYRALHLGKSGQDYNPIFYVSSSTWNIYDVLKEFLEINGLPAGPLLLCDLFSLETALSFTHEQHKLSHIRPIFACYPALSFILIGDSGQQDAEIYYQLVREYPDQVLAIYIRNVNPADQERRQRLNAIAHEVQQRGIPFVTVSDTLIAATHAVRRGWIAAEVLPDIQTNQRHVSSR